MIMWQTILSKLEPGRTLEIGVNLRDALTNYFNNKFGGGSTAATLSTILNRIDDMANTISEIRDAIAEQKTALDAELVEIQSKLDSLAEGGTEAERGEIITEIRTMTDRIRGIIAAGPENPPTDEG